MYVDTDFVGMWHHEYSEFHECTLSCLGYIITYCSFLIHWVSKLPSEMAMSTTESEFIVCYMATQNLCLFITSFKLHKHALFAAQLVPAFSCV
jgi:hypothetical protein